MSGMSGGMYADKPREWEGRNQQNRWWNVMLVVVVRVEIGLRLEVGGATLA